MALHGKPRQAIKCNFPVLKAACILITHQIQISVTELENPPNLLGEVIKENWNFQYEKK